MIDPIDPVDELILRSHDHPELQKFHQFHKANRAVLAFIISEIQLRLDHGFTAFSFGDLLSYCRWKLDLQRSPGERFALNDHLGPWFARAIVVLYPEYNGLAELRVSTADEVFGLRFEPESNKRKGRARRLEWLDGTPLEAGWRPTNPHVVTVANRRPDIHPRTEVANG